MECRIPGTDEKSFGYPTAFVIKFSIKQEQPVLQEGNRDDCENVIKMSSLFCADSLKKWNLGTIY